VDTYEFHRGMKDHFGIVTGVGRFICPTFIITKKISLNIVEFDCWIMENLGYDYTIKEGLSMKDAITKYYGEEAMLFIKKSLGGR